MGMGWGLRRGKGKEIDGVWREGGTAGYTAQC